MVCQVKITWYGPPKYNIGDNIFEISKQIFIKDKYCMINQTHIKYCLQANTNI